MSNREDGTMSAAVREHLSECDECHASAAVVGEVDSLLRASSESAIDVKALSQRVLLAARAELASRARLADWPRLAAAVVGGLLPLPLVLGVNALFAAWLHTLLISVGLPTVATYAVVSYAAGLVFTLGATYAAIPVLAERSAGPRLIPLM